MHRPHATPLGGCESDGAGKPSWPPTGRCPRPHGRGSARPTPFCDLAEPLEADSGHSGPFGHAHPKLMSAVDDLVVAEAILDPMEYLLQNSGHTSANFDVSTFAQLSPRSKQQTVINAQAAIKASTAGVVAAFSSSSGKLLPPPRITPQQAALAASKTEAALKAAAIQRAVAASKVAAASNLARAAAMGLTGGKPLLARGAGAKAGAKRPPSATGRGGARGARGSARGGRARITRRRPRLARRAWQPWGARQPRRQGLDKARWLNGHFEKSSCARAGGCEGRDRQTGCGARPRGKQGCVRQGR